MNKNTKQFFKARLNFFYATFPLFEKAYCRTHQFQCYTTLKYKK